MLALTIFKAHCLLLLVAWRRWSSLMLLLEVDLLLGCGIRSWLKLSLREALSWLTEQGLSNIVVECDALSVIHTCNFHNLIFLYLGWLLKIVKLFYVSIEMQSMCLLKGLSNEVFWFWVTKFFWFFKKKVKIVHFLTTSASVYGTHSKLVD